MSDYLFDIERLRKNWEPRQEERPPVVHRVLAQVEATQGPFRNANELLARIAMLTMLRFPGHRTALGSFFHEARELLETYQRTSDKPAAPPLVEGSALQPPEAEDAEAPSTEETPTDPLVALRSTLDQLEVLFEVFSLGSKLGVPSRRA
jgi:hypothetical protein